MRIANWIRSIISGNQRQVSPAQPRKALVCALEQLGQIETPHQYLERSAKLGELTRITQKLSLPGPIVLAEASPSITPTLILPDVMSVRAYHELTPSGPYCVADVALHHEQVMLLPPVTACKSTSNSSIFDCIDLFATYSSGFANLAWAQNVSAVTISTPLGLCLQFDGHANPLCNATSIIVNCKPPEFSQTGCIMRSMQDGSCMQWNMSSFAPASSLLQQEGCSVVGRTAAFNCDSAFDKPCALLNGTSSHQNCSAICSTPDLLFESLSTFAFCSARAIDYSYDSHFNMLTFSSTDSILPQTNACMQQYCSNPYSDLGGQCPYQNHTSIQDFLSTCTQDVSIKLNPDVGGIGVAISYILQIAITLYFWLLVRSLSAMSWILRSEQFHKVSLLRLISADTRQRIQVFLKRHLAILRSASVEFLEAQVFFVIATQVSVIVVLTHRSGIFETYSTTESDSNNSFLLLIDAIAIYTMLLLLLLLHSSNLMSWYIFTLSFVGAVTTLVSYYFSHGNQFPDTITPIPYAATLDQCGGNSPPIALCPSLGSLSGNVKTTDALQVNFTRRGVFPATVQSYNRPSLHLPVEPWNPAGPTALWVIIIVLLLVHKINIAFIPDPDTNDSESVKNVWKLHNRIVTLVSFILELLVVFFIASTSVGFRNWQLSGAMILNGGWSIGQVIALFVWASPISKYLYWTACGMTGYSNVRIAKPYFITVDTQDQAAPAIVTGADEESEGTVETASISSYVTAGTVGANESTRLSSIDEDHDQDTRSTHRSSLVSSCVHKSRE
ncbi:hypothetical protein BDV96DRAFT_641928 [Lophiotrema nucula]|uniref:Uncharacterized protein n=1 Tax=Lophiotrema nucula TaxID=690887 RepID=A0A6A5ZL29_9PLEO|nr:hypothetical protein BDV96DRAFT_641928 [Lophiotrema nucula]